LAISFGDEPTDKKQPADSKAEQLEKLLQRCVKMWQELPQKDGVIDIEKAAIGLAQSLESAREHCRADGSPSEAVLDDIAKKTAQLLGGLEKEREALEADDPFED
jgi:hypothetical protein